MNSDLWASNEAFLVGSGDPGGNGQVELVDARGQKPATSGMLQVWGIYAQDVGVPMRWALREIVPPGVRVLDDPSRFFLDRLVRISVSQRVKGALRQDGSVYLLPFRRESLDWLAPLGIQVLEGTTEPSRQTVSVTFRQQESWKIVELWVPLRNGLFMRASRRYDSASIVDRWVPRIAVWPDFESRGWASYFYYRGELGRGQDDELVLEPYFPEGVPRRSKGTGSQWWRSTRPTKALLAADHRGHEVGFALGPFSKEVSTPTADWRLSIDLGSTHTRMFFVSQAQSTPQPLTIKPRAAVLTGKESGVSDQEFFRIDVHPPMDELPTQVLLSLRPNDRGGVEISPENWTPADGVAVLGQVQRDFFFDDEVKLFTEVKWNLTAGANDPAVVFLSHVLLLAEAEAYDNGARLSEVRHSYPSAFPPLLVENFEHRWSRLLPERDDRPSNGGSEAEAVSVMKYLAFRENAAPATTLLAIDIGGSTSDIAVWQENNCYCLESIRFAASAISAFLCLDALWKPYCDLLPGLGLNTSGGGPIRGDLASLPPESRLPLLYATLNFLQEKNQITALRMQFESKEVLRPFLVHCSFIYGALLYYMGLIARELGGGPDGERQEYQIYLCGKGAKFFDWLERQSVSSGLEALFLAGLRGSGALPNDNASVTFKLSAKPKWEVGFGRLVEAHFEERGGSPFGGENKRDRLEPRSVRVGESGYQGLASDDPLDREQLRTLTLSGDSAVPRSFPEFENFLSTWALSAYSNGAAILPSFRNALVERLLGRVEGSVGYEMADAERARRFSLEPLFFTQCKVFYEQVAGVPPSLWLGRLPGWDRR